MKRSDLYIVAILLFSFIASSCNDFLDKEPDNRGVISTPDQITSLLVNAYSDQNYAVLGELSSDNFIDNNAPDSKGNRFNLGSLERMDDEIFAFQDVITSDQQDSPSEVWRGCYHAIAVANQALQAIAALEAQGRGDEVKAQKGEALISRAFHHFILVNLFSQAYKNDTLSQMDVGIPYVTAPETKVLVHYDRSNVAVVYKMIQTDIEAGISLVAPDDKNYSIPKYHFNYRAAHAFATRFYLFNRNYAKVIEHANLVIGTTPAFYLRNWNAEYPTFEAFENGWINASSPNNFLLLPTYSLLDRLFGTRYSCNGDAAKSTIYGGGPTWSSYPPCLSGRLYIRGSQDYGLFFPKCGEFFEYTDKIAGIGYPHIVRAEFTGEETLLCRAEALVFLNRLPEALADLKAFDDSRKMTGKTQPDLTDAVIKSFYKSSNTLFSMTLNTQFMSPDFIVTDAQKPYIDCVLHFRRLETIFDGMRFFDIKRYGIEITHKIGKDIVEKLTWNDPRRAIQIPNEVISAGMSPNFRLVNTMSPSENVLLKIQPEISDNKPEINKKTL